MIQKLSRREQLTPEEVSGVAEVIMSGESTPVQVAGFLTALSMRGETAEDLVAFARVLRSKMVPFCRPEGIILDTCGTGGDHSGTFNISTAAAFVAAGAGVRVAKHGNRSMTSKCGSADVLAELGVGIDSPTEVMEQALAEIGVCFLFAQQYHHSMKNVAVVRRELGIRTIFNRLGPLLNPAAAQHQLIGVFSRDLTGMQAEALRELGSRRALVVHGADGLDEITTTGVTNAAELFKGEIREVELKPSDFGIRMARREDLAGGDPAENAEMVEEILLGMPGPRADIVILNAGAAIYVAEQAATVAEGVEKARLSVKSGAAKEKLEELRVLTKASRKGQG
ncbi:MAG: anthranilate phosphoribosyltransferase [Candidatus Sumerlaeaceae bacterium]|nr:anthranilate phosphoribosyltransferase [Candidatus Sumerlaeaceae bacterium]